MKERWERRTILRGAAVVLLLAVPALAEAQWIDNAALGVRRPLPAERSAALPAAMRSDLVAARDSASAGPGRHMLLGAVVGGLLGAVAGSAIDSDACDGSWPSGLCPSVASSIALTGAAVGAVTGWLVWRARRPRS